LQKLSSENQFLQEAVTSRLLPLLVFGVVTFTLFWFASFSISGIAVAQPLKDNQGGSNQHGAPGKQNSNGSNGDPHPDPKPHPNPDPSPAPNPDPNPAPTPDPNPAPNPDPNPVPPPDPNPAPNPDPNPVPPPDPNPAPNPDPSPSPDPPPAPITDPRPNPGSASLPELARTLVSEPVLVESMPSDLVSEQTNDSEKVAIQPQEGLKNVTPGGMPRLVNGLLGGFLEGDEAPTLTAALSAPTTLEGLKDVAKGLAAEMMQLVNSLISGIDGEGQPFAPAALEELKELAKGLAAAVIQLAIACSAVPAAKVSITRMMASPSLPLPQPLLLQSPLPPRVLPLTQPRGLRAMLS
jgi:outer membrane biosynthesis protein TonB